MSTAQITVREHPDDFAVLDNGHMPNIEVVQNCDGFCEGCVSVNADRFAGHEFFDDHGVLQR